MALTAALVTTLAAVPAAAQGLPGTPAATGTTRTVTLITGDQVTMRDEQAVGVRMAKGREHLHYLQYRLNGHDHVVPLDAAPLLQQGRLDDRLFDVTGLVQQEYDDAREPNVPTMVSSTPGTGRLGALGLTTNDIPKTKAATAWRDMASQRAAQVQKIWLNGKVKPSLDKSVPQVGAPQAWQRGLRGDGVKVAVLDTGYDAGHPDLKSKVDAEANFTGEGDARTDLVGHGTHVASTIAGVDSRYTGVAPGARLLIGKVLGQYGGREDWIIAGMQWATEQGAKVVNLSLGGGPTDGTDLMSQTVNKLSESTGTLFVIAAGNSGANGTVGSPGAADRALTVGSVTKSDELSAFSSRGPRAGDYGLKPEISAPGSDIVAARAAGTLGDVAVDQYHARLSGTSMATPHVAGAAAILAGQHPDWTGEQIKSVLVGSAKRLPGIDTHAQGSGRLDIARGVSQQVRTEGLAAFGKVWGKQVPQRKISYVNDGDRPVRLSIDVDVNRPDLFTVGSSSVTVPAKSATTITVSAKASERPEGEFTGAITAHGDGITLTTPLTANLAGDKQDLAVKMPPREGDPYFAAVILTNEKTGVSEGALTQDGVARFTVPSGDYRMIGLTQDNKWNMTMFAERAQVRSATEVVVDVKRGKQVTASIDDPDARPQAGGATAITSDVDGSGPIPGTLLYVGGSLNDKFPLYTVGGPKMPGVELTHFGYWAYPYTLGTIGGTGGFEYSETYTPWPLAFQGTVSGPAIDVGEADTESIERAGDLTGAIALIAPKDWGNWHYPPGEQLLKGIELLKAKGARAVLSYFNPAVDSADAIPALSTIMLFDGAEVQRTQELLKQRPVEITLFVRPDSPVAYFLGDQVSGGLPEGHNFTYRRETLGRVERQLVDTLPAGRYRYHFGIWTVGNLTAAADVETRWPQRRTDYVPAGVPLSMEASAGFMDFSGFGNEYSLPVTLRSGEQRPSRVFGAPFGPELTTPPISRQDGKPLPWAYRERDQLRVSVPMFADSDPGNVSRYDDTNKGSTVLLKDGKQIGRSDVPGIGTFDLPRGPGRFQLIADADRPASAGQYPALSTKTRAEWTFRAGNRGNGREALPLLDIRFGLPLDDHNSAAAGQELTGDVTAVHQPGARTSPAPVQSVEVSFDEGKTWQRATVTGNQVKIPVGGTAGGYVSLRATARDADGNTVTETVTRAYALR